MRLGLAVTTLVATVSVGAAMAPHAHWGSMRRSLPMARSAPPSPLHSSTIDRAAEASAELTVATDSDDAAVAVSAATSTPPSQPRTLPPEPVMESSTSAAEYTARLQQQLEKLSANDGKSPHLSKEEIKVIFEDEHIIVVDKPAGVLSAPDAGGNANLGAAVHEHYDCKMDDASKMVVHRLGMATSGLMVLARTPTAVRELNAQFRARLVERQYEALVCGHMAQSSGWVDVPLMRDYQFPPYMRVSTPAQQEMLLQIDEAQLEHKKILEQPKASLTKYDVLAGEMLDGHVPVTRVRLTSISGRTHQLNVHMAALGHPVVGDDVYGYQGAAAPNGGLTRDEQNLWCPNDARASLEELMAIQKVSATDGRTRVHAQSLRFRHPVTQEEMALESAAPF